MSASGKEKSQDLSFLFEDVSGKVLQGRRLQGFGDYEEIPLSRRNPPFSKKSPFLEEIPLSTYFSRCLSACLRPMHRIKSKIPNKNLNSADLLLAFIDYLLS